METSDRPTRTDRHMTRDLEGELLLYDAADGEIYVLNDTARQICLSCDGRHSVDDLVHEIVSTFDVDEATARTDVEGTLERLMKLGVIALNPAQPPPA